MVADKVTAFGHRLDLSAHHFGWLTQSDLSAASIAHLRDQAMSDGYLYFRDFWPRAQVQAVRNALVQQLWEKELLQPGTEKDACVAIPGHEIGRAMGHPLNQKTPQLQDLVFGDRIMTFFTEFLGGPARHFDYIWFRTKGPGHGSAIHCDLVYMGRGTQNIYTAWIPLGDIDLDMGGLLLLEGSHNKAAEIQPYLSRDVDSYCVNRKSAAAYASGEKWWDGTLSRNPITLQSRLGGRWLTAKSFSMGDVLLFNMKIVHCSLDNQTNRVRLSVDTRYQLSSDAIDPRWIGERPPGHALSMRNGRIC